MKGALIVDGDPRLRAFIGAVLEPEGLPATGVSGADEAVDLLREQVFDLVIADVGECGTEPPEILRLCNECDRPPVFVALMARAEPSHAAEVIKAGAVDVLVKPIEEGRLRQVVQKARRQRLLLEELGRLREELRNRTGPSGLIGRSPALVALRERLERLALDDSTVWFVGEVGTGRELSARILQALSSHSGGPFVVVRRGSGREMEKLAQRAAGGLLYLDDVPAMPPDLQLRIGELLASPVGFRVGCSSVETAAVAVERGRLVPELQARLRAETVLVPPLRERVEDIPILARHFVRAVCSINFLPPIPIAAEAMDLLQSYPWPENVRELRNAMEHAVIVSPDGTIRPRDLPEPIRRLDRSPGTSVRATSRRFREAKREVVDKFEAAYLGELMQCHGGNVTAAALQAGMLRSALQRLLRKHGIKSARFRPSGGFDADDEVQPS